MVEMSTRKNSRRRTSMAKSLSNRRNRLDHEKFQIHCGDGIAWALRHKRQIPAVVTSCPDMSEVAGILPKEEGAKEAAYVRFFRRCAAAALAAVADGGYAVFVQTDRKSHGLLDKSYLITDEAMKAGFRMMFHKITLIRDVGATDLYKPTYSHVLCYSRGAGAPGQATPDVCPRGKTLYTNGMGVDTTRRIMKFLQSKDIHFIADPFVGRGTTLLIAKKMGMRGGIGVDIDPEQCKATEAALQKGL